MINQRQFYSKTQEETNQTNLRLQELRGQLASSIDRVKELKSEYQKLRASKQKIFKSGLWGVVKTLDVFLSFFGISKRFDKQIGRLNNSLSIVNKEIKNLLDDLKELNQNLISASSGKNLYIIDPDLVDFEKVGKVSLPPTEAPVVSIIIPAFNQARHTYASILSVLHHTSEQWPYEVILIDDCSQEAEARHMSDYFENLVFIKNETNLGFLKNCNKAAKLARGQYLVFLNNDTNVQPNWLSSLIGTIEEDPSTGMIGSRLVYPSGLQQEAGGIIWSDGTGWNFGKMYDPSDYMFNYVKEVDYISGAAILVKKELWDEIGGFDLRYVPAYFEDTDLAFEVREKGYKVKYQPESWVVHFEGVSHGTDESSGIKEYQKKNREKFRKKWEQTLSSHFKNGENVFLAKDRGQFKKTILFVDHYAPKYDQDAGSRSTFGYIKLLTGLGFNVKFLGDNFFFEPKYSTALQQLGVEVLYGQAIKDSFEKWIDANGSYIDYVFFNRPHITEKYLSLIKENTTAKLLYYGHDLHFLREQRASQKTSAKKDSIESWKAIEFEIMSKVDASFYPSEVEVNLIKSLHPEVEVAQIPVYIFEEFIRYERNAKLTNDIIFCGGFKHPPNVDGIQWFVKEVWPTILNKNQQIKLYIVGSNPPEEILTLQDDNIIVTGFVPDDELLEFYRNCRIAIAPLRFGAGIKGKVVEALYHQVPLITTSIGAEGLLGIEQCSKVYDESEEYAGAILDLYDNFDELDRMSNEGFDFCQKNFSQQAACEALKPFLNF